METSTHFSATPLNTIISNRVRNSPASNSDEPKGLTDSQLKQIQQLKSRDQVVKAHESAHISAGGGLTGGAQYSYQRGPDGVQYAVGGEVQIDVSAVAGDPQATLQKAQKIQAAALAPAQPSAQDRQVAAKAAQMAIEARAEIQQQQKNDDSNSQNISSIFSSPEEQNTQYLDLIA